MADTSNIVGAATAARPGMRVLRTFGLAFSLALTGAIAPGPLLALVIGQVLAQGVRAAVLILAGHALIETVFVLLLARGLGGALSRPRVRGTVSVIGGLVLVWMGIELIQNSRGMTLAGDAAAALPWYSLVAAGIGVSLANPYFTGWWATVGTGQVAALELRTRTDYGAFFIGHECGDLSWYLFVAVMLALGRQWVTDRLYSGLLLACGASIVALAGFFLWRGVAELRRAPAPDGCSPSGRNGLA